MTNAKNTKRALLSSLMALFLCLAMLLGATFAWFTDSVSSTGNKVVSGTLKVDLELLDKDTQVWNSIKESKAPIFDYDKWEPGYTDVKILKVENEGTLALKWKARFISQYQISELANVIDVYVCPSESELSYPDNRELTGYTNVGTLAQFINTIEDTTYGVLDAREAAYLGIALKMKETAGNEYQNMSLGGTFDIQILATQMTAEEDSFDNNYDNESEYPNPPASSSVTIVAGQAAKLAVTAAPSATTKTTTIDIPANSFAEGKEVSVDISTDNSLFEVTNEGAVVGKLNIEMTVDNATTSGDLEDAYYTVTTYISKGLNEVTVTYVGTDGKAQPTEVTYDASTGKLTFKTNHFSEYEVSGKALAYDKENDVAINDVVTIVEAAKNSDSTIVVPVVNTEAVATEISKAIEEGTISETVVDNDLKEKFYVAKIGSIFYATLSDAFENAVNNDTIILLNNVVIDGDNTITIPEDKTLTLDLNGKTCDAITDDADKNNDGKITSADNEVVIDVRGTLTVKNGTMTIKHTSDNLLWNGCTEVFYVAFNGTLNVENATIKNLGGSDMAYSIDLVNATTTTLNVKNSTIDSTYIAIRIFNNNSNGMNNVTINDTEMVGKFGFWVHIYTDKDTNGNGIRNSTLNFDVFNGTNSFKVTGKSPVIYGFTDVMFMDENGNVLFVEAETEKGLRDAIANGYEVHLYNDIVVSSKISVPNGKNIVLDLNGKTLSGAFNNQGGSALIENNGTLTIKNGKVISLAQYPDVDWGEEGFPTYATNTISNKGILVIESDAIIENQTDVGGASYAVDNYSGATLTVNGGTLIAKDVAIRMFSNSATAENKVVINSGSITGKRAVWIHLPSSDSSVAPKTTLEIHGGELVNTGTLNIYSYSYGNSFAATNVTITGGTFSGDIAFGGGYKGDRETVTVTGGTFNGVLGRYLDDDGWENIAKP